MRKQWFWIGVFLAAFIYKVEAAAERLFYLSDGKVLTGCVYKPSGKGPFPTIIFNQNSTKPWDTSGTLDPFPQLANFFTSRGYVLFLTGRHKSDADADDAEPGKEAKDTEGDRKPLDAAQGYLQNITAAMLTLKTQSFVDPDRVVVMGTAAGATATLLFAEQNLDIRGYVVFSPASGIWKRSDSVRAALTKAVETADAPIFLIQPQNDFGLGPTEVLGKIIDSKGRLNQTKIYPPFGANQKDSRSFATTATNVWGVDVLQFIAQITR